MSPLSAESTFGLSPFFKKAAKKTVNIARLVLKLKAVLFSLCPLSSYSIFCTYCRAITLHIYSF